jgi:hypothetical protein
MANAAKPYLHWAGTRMPSILRTWSSTTTSVSAGLLNLVAAAVACERIERAVVALLDTAESIVVGLDLANTRYGRPLKTPKGSHTA